MNSSSDPGGRHETATELIPWLVNGRLSDAETARVQSHLTECAQCRAEVASERRIMQLLQRSPRVDYAPQASLQKLWARIEEMERELPTRLAPDASRSARTSSRASLHRWALTAGIACALGLSALVAAGWRPRALLEDGPYRTATSGPPALARAAQIRVVFAPAVTMDELTRIASANRLTIVEGPSDAGVFGLAMSPGSNVAVDEALERLRTDPRIRFAERVHTAPVVGP